MSKRSNTPFDSAIRASLVAILAALMTIGFSHGIAKAAWPGAKFIEFGQARLPEAQVTAVQADGKILVAGYAQEGGWPHTRLIITRLMPDGSFDREFGENGRAMVPSQGIWAFFDIGIQKSGSIVVLGTGNEEIGIVRVSPDGESDPSFGRDGVSKIRFRSNWAIPWGSITIAPDDRITFGGTSYRPAPKPQRWRKETVVWRLTADGRRDPSLAGDGLVTRSGAWSRINLAGFSEEDGSVITVGTTRIEKRLIGDFAILGPSLSKLGPSGKPDPTFGSRGILKLRGLYTAAPRGFKMRACLPSKALIDSQGRVVILASCLAQKVNGGALPLMGVLLRYLPNGSVDKSFARDGSRALVGRISTLYSGLAESSDGSLTVTGSDINSRSTVLFRVDQGGRVSQDFGPRGYRYYAKRNQQFGPSISVDGRGWTYGPITRYFDADNARGERSWFGVVAIPRSGKL